MTQPSGKISSTDSKTRMSLASTPTAPALTPAAPMIDSGKILRKTNDFSARKQRAENEDGERLLHYLEEANHVQKLHSSVKYGMRISPVFNDFLEKAHEMWQQDKQEDGESEDEEEEDDYLPPLPAFKITSKNKYTYLEASVFLVKEFQQETDMSSRKRKGRDTPDDRAVSSQTGRNVKQRAILHEDEQARLTPYPIKSMLKMGRSGIRFGSPVGNPLSRIRRSLRKTYIYERRSFGRMCMMT